MTRIHSNSFVYLLYILVSGWLSPLYAQTDPDYVAVVRSPVATSGVVTTIQVYRGDSSHTVTFDEARLIQREGPNERYRFMNNPPRIPSGARRSVSSEPATLTLPVTIRTRDKTGIYTITVTKNGEPVTWRVLVTNEDAFITFENSSAVVSRNEPFTVTATVSSGFPPDEIRWRRDGHFHDYIDCPLGDLSCPQTSTSSHVYEMHRNTFYGRQVHAIMSVIVRGCPDGMWGPSDCDMKCQSCINGGICSHQTGACLCPPGFSGDNCQEIHGRNVFGKNAEYKCNAVGDDHDSGCQGAMICYPEPFGCICPAGYTGLNCDDECQDGRFGANCKQECHCPNSVSCAKDTGVCDSNQCMDRWQGINCQYCMVGYYGTDCNERCSCPDDNCNEIQASCASGCFMPWTGLACDRNTGGGSISISSTRVNPGVVTTVVCLVIRNPLVESSDMMLAGADVSLFNTTVDERGYTTTRAWSVTLDSEKTLTCSVDGTSLTDSMTVEPYDLLRYSSSAPLSISDVTPTRIRVSWRKWQNGTDGGDGPVESYILEYREEWESQFSEVTEGMDLIHNFTDLQSDTMYEFRIILVRPGENGRGMASNVESQRTSCEDSARFPGDVRLEIDSSTSLAFRWNASTCSVLGDDISYMYELLDGNTSVASSATSDLSIVFEGLLPFTNYTFMVKAELGPANTPVMVMTLEDVPGPPDGNVTNTTENTLTLAWNDPRLPNGVITNYKILYRAVGRPYNSYFVNESFSEPIEQSATSSGQYEITGLDPSTVYEVRLSAFTQIGEGEPFVITASTAIFSDLEPPKLDIKPNSTIMKDGTVTLTLPPLKQQYATSYLVRVQVDTTRQTRNVGSYGSYEDNPDHYIAAEVNKSGGEQTFIIGDGGTYGGYYNAPLNENKDYSVFVGTASKTSKDVHVVWAEPLPLISIVIGTTVLPPATSTGTKIGTTIRPTGDLPFVAIAIGAAVAAFLLLLLVVLIACCCCRRSKKEPEPVQHQKPTSKPHAARTSDGVMNPSYEATDALNLNTVKERSIPVSELVGYVKRKKANPEDNFLTEFESIPDNRLYPWTVASKEENKTKNRYGNILPYDSSRVVLQRVGNDPHSDYINASYINGYMTPKKFIASHGPNKASVHDFWRMVWQEDVDKIVMLTALVESDKRKCKKYWPDVLEQFGDISVVRKSMEEFPIYEIKTFHVTRDGSNETKVVRHFHFTGWRDMNVPSTGPFLAFLNLVRSEGSLQSGPTVVHCSAGVGRTGTYIAIDAMLDMAAAEQRVNVYDFILELRQKRYKSVQTEDQYEFIFDALLTALVVGETGIKLETFRADLAKLKVTNNITGNTHLEDQFEKLENISELNNPLLLRKGKLPQNRDKNRSPNILPVESYRPFLMTDVGDQGNDYINASFLRGYQKKDMFLATQMPLKNTMLDFWRLVWDFKITKIVMLNDLGSEAEEYWSETGIATYGPFVIQFRSREFVGDVCVRELEVCNSTLKYQNFRTVTHMQCLGWPNDSVVPPSPKLLLSTINQLNKVLDPSDPAAVLVQCMDGAGRTGMFCCLMSAMDQAKAESAVDIFPIIQTMRLARPHMVENAMQYQCILDAFVMYLGDTQDYQNLMI